MNTQKMKPNKISTRRMVLDAWISGKRPGSGWTKDGLRRAARNRVYDEDVLQKELPPVTDELLKAAIESCREEHKENDPEYPKNARERHQRQREQEQKPFPWQKPKILTPDEQQLIESFKEELMEMVHVRLEHHNSTCEELSLELSDEATTAISDKMSTRIDDLLPKKVSALQSEASKDRIREGLAEEVDELIQAKIDEEQEEA